MAKKEQTECKIVGWTVCPDCGAKIPVKVSKNGCLFNYCTNEIDKETGEKCYYRRWWGRKLSRKLLKEEGANFNGTTSIGREDIIREQSENGIDISAWGF